MKLKPILKWSVRVILVALPLSILAVFIAYWRSTNDCEHMAALNVPMKAIRFCEYGSPDVLKFEDVEKPVPNDDQVLIRVRAASLNFIDPGAMRGPWPLRLMSGLRKPEKTMLGNDLAGQVEAVGKNVTLFKTGDEVFGVGRLTLAEYACASERGLVIKPADVTFEQAGCVAWAGFTALQGLQTGKIAAGQKVLINGASGGVGTFAVQIAKAFGAEVTAVCSPRNVDLARSIGADHVIDYTQEDFTRNGQRYDLILAVNGYHPIFAYRRALGPTGRYVLVGGSKAQLYQALLQALLLGPVISRTGRQKMGFMGIAKINQKDLVYVKELLEAGKVVPVIERRYPLRETAEALRYLEEGHARGKVVITVDQNNKT